LLEESSSDYSWLQTNIIYGEKDEEKRPWEVSYSGHIDLIDKEYRRILKEGNKYE
jgi:hypothetical protein